MEKEQTTFSSVAFALHFLSLTSRITLLLFCLFVFLPVEFTGEAHHKHVPCSLLTPAGSGEGDGGLGSEVM